MKVLIIGGNRFVGLRLSHALAKDKNIDLNIVNRTGQVAHAPGASVYKADRRNLKHSHIDRDFDVIVDFAAYTDADLQESLDYFQKVGRYIFISTGSVYDSGANLSENAFDPALVDLKAKPVANDHPGSYQDGKRRAEALLTQAKAFPFASIRFPFLLGPDDYTRRLEFHVQRVEKNKPIFAPAPQSKFSMLHAEDACRFLQWSLTQDFTGPLNVAAPRPISLNEILKQAERATGRKALLVDRPAPENVSPYGIGEDLFFDVRRAQRLGFEARPYEKWLGELIEGALENPKGPSQLH